MPVPLTQKPAPYDDIPNRMRWTRRQCAALRDDGFLTGSYELIDGEILSKMGQKPAHAYIIRRLSRDHGLPCRGRGRSPRSPREVRPHLCSAASHLIR